MKNYLLLSVITLMTIFCGCSLLRKGADGQIGEGSVISTGSEQLAYIYNPAATTIHPRVFVRKNNNANTYINPNPKKNNHNI
jgi:hypothetical protein